MTIQSALWKTPTVPFTIHSIPKWPCPFCGEPSLKIDFDSLKLKRTKKQFDPADYKMDDFEDNAFLGLLTAISIAFDKSSWVQHRFVGFLDCTNCSDSVAISGRAEVYRTKQNQAVTLPARIYPEYFSPSLQVFRLDPIYPENVRKLLIKSFSLLFSDPASGANVVRRSIEVLLDEVGVGRTNDKGKSLNLYKRIEVFEAEYREIAGMLNAIRFIGNEGSHSGDVSRDDLVDAFEIIDYVLDDIFLRSEKKARIKSLSEKMTTHYR